MKKVFKLFAMLMVASVFTFSFSSCEKTPDEPTPAALTVQDLAGTSWRCTMENSYVQQGIVININFESILDFLDTEHGEYFEMVVVEVPVYPAANQQMDQTFDYTYTVEGNKILVTMYYEDENGEEVSDTAEFIYDAATQTISLDTDSPEMEEMMGTDTYVYTKVQ